MLCKIKKELTNHAKFASFRQKPSDEFFKNNRSKFTATFKKMSKLSNSYLFLKGPVSYPIYDDDMEYPVVPENFFYYMTGCAEPNTYALYNVDTERIFLFVVVVDPSISFWEKHKSIQDMMDQYHIPDVFKSEEITKVFNEQVGKDDPVLVYEGKNPYSNLATLNVLEDFSVIYILFF